MMRMVVGMVMPLFIGVLVAAAARLLTVRMGCEGRYLATSRGVRPVTVNTMMSAASSLAAARTAAEASDSVCSKQQRTRQQLVS